MSQILIRHSTPSRDTYDAADAYEAGMTPDTFTESRAVVQQFASDGGSLDCMFTLEMSQDKETIVLKAFDPDRMVATSLSYDTAAALYEALSNHLDILEADIENTYIG